MIILESICDSVIMTPLLPWCDMSALNTPFVEFNTEASLEEQPPQVIPLIFK